VEVLAFTKYNYSGASSRYRYYNYINCFQSHNINLSVSPFFSDSYFNSPSFFHKLVSVFIAYIHRIWLILVILLFKKNNLIIIEYELIPYFPATFERLMKLRRIKYIVDYDDAIFHKYDKHKNVLIRWLFKNKIPYVMTNAETVIVGNAYLQDFAKKHNSKTQLLPTVVQLKNYESSMNGIINKNDKSFIIGWIGSKTTSQYIFDILPALEKFVKTYDAKCHFVGFDENLLTNDIKEKCKITIIPWSEQSEIKNMLEFDVGIMPLKDDAWSKGKCGFKLIQYMSCKKPVVASPIGVNTTIVTEGINGFLATSNDQWFTAIEKLYHDKELRKSMANNNWKKIISEYNYDLNCKKYVSSIKNIVGYD